MKVTKVIFLWISIFLNKNIGTSILLQTTQFHTMPSRDDRRRNDDRNNNNRRKPGPRCYNALLTVRERRRNNRDRIRDLERQNNGLTRMQRLLVRLIRYFELQGRPLEDWIYRNVESRTDRHRLYRFFGLHGYPQPAPDSSHGDQFKLQKNNATFMLIFYATLNFFSI